MGELPVYVPLPDWPEDFAVVVADQEEVSTWPNFPSRSLNLTFLQGSDNPCRYPNSLTNDYDYKKQQLKEKKEIFGMFS